MLVDSPIFHLSLPEPGCLRTRNGHALTPGTAGTTTGDDNSDAPGEAPENSGCWARFAAGEHRTFKWVGCGWFLKILPQKLPKSVF